MIWIQKQHNKIQWRFELTKQDPAPGQPLKVKWTADDEQGGVALPISVLLKLSEKGLDVTALQADLNAIPNEELFKPLVPPEPR